MDTVRRKSPSPSPKIHSPPKRSCEEMNPHFFAAPFYFAFIWFRVQGSGLSWRLRRNYTYDDTRSPFSPSFLWKEVPRRGGGWPRVTVLPHSRKPPPPRFARLPLPEEGARMFFLGNTDYIVVIRSQGLALPTHMTRCSAFLICLSCRLCPNRPCGAPSPRGEG